MSAVTFGANAGLPFTVEELDRLPDDGRRYELLDGVLVVSPRPTTIYQFAAFQLGKVLDAACPEDLCVMPVTITPAHLTSRLRRRGSEAG